MAEANADIYGSEIYDVPRQKSRCKVIVYSHISSNPDDKDYNGIVDCSNDVIRCDTSKTIKGGGNAGFTLVPRRNYVNFIYPNDHVHIYFDPGDGRGWIRTFFGFVDRIERTITSSGVGMTETRYVVSCTDFTKAFDRVNVYFNPHVADRGDFVAQFFGKNVVGEQLMSKGVAIQGTPADIVMSLSTLMLGMGQQYQVPASFAPDKGLVDHSRKKRLRHILSGLKSEYQELAGKGELEERKKKIEAEYQRVANQYIAKQLGEPLPVDLDKPVPVVDLENLSLNELESMLSRKAKEVEEVNSTRYSEAMNAQRQAYGQAITLLDIMDFSFVEYGAIDGSILSPQIWTSQGPLWGLMNSWSNGMINELFCDLRLVTENESYDLAEGPYSKSPDEIRGNTGGGVRTVPAMIMREYPFSTIAGIDSKVRILADRSIGWISFGGDGNDPPVWVKDVNVPGRKVNEITTLNPFRWTESEGTETGQKHIDVGVISVTDIVSESLGRSDDDVVNLIEVYSDVGNGPTMKYMSSTVQPVSNPISIMRDGLRVRSFTTKFARWPSNILAKGKGGVDDAPARYQSIRWALLLDHWYQHNKEYLSGSMVCRAFPEIRVGYRLDVKERQESYYVEGVNHSWSYTEAGAMLMSTFTVSRGQRNDPFPVYVLPALKGFGGFKNRNHESRLAEYFPQMNPTAVIRSSLLNATTSASTPTWGGAEAPAPAIEFRNTTDNNPAKRPWGKNTRGYRAAGAGSGASKAARDSAVGKDTRKTEDKTRTAKSAKVNSK